MGKTKRARRPPSGREPVDISIPFEIRPEVVLPQKDIQLLQTETPKAAFRSEGSQKVCPAAANGGDDHPPHFFATDETAIDHVDERCVHGVEQRPVTKLSIMIDRHRHDCELGSRAQLTFPVSKESLPILCGLPGKRSPRGRIMAEGYLHLMGMGPGARLNHCTAQELHASVTLPAGRTCS